MESTRVMPVDIYVIHEEQRRNPDANRVSEDNPVHLLINDVRHDFMAIIYFFF